MLSISCQLSETNVSTRKPCRLYINAVGLQTKSGSNYLSTQAES